MIHLTTGSNGAGKTLNTLKWVRDLQVEQGRSVYYANLNMKPEKAAEFGWQKFEVDKWRDLPDGAILVIDECQDFFGPRPNGSKVPDHIADMAKHRHRGFDFFLITQHPKLLDSFIKSQIGSPGWHRHCKRPFGQNATSVLEWSAVHAQPEKDGSGKAATVRLVPHPKEVYDWYASATLHTNKKRMPRQVYVIAAAAVLVPLLGFFAFQKLDPTKRGTAIAAGVSPAGSVAAGPAKPALDEFAQVLQDYQPRLADFPHTAPRYDEVTKPVVAPYPAACIARGTDCTCYSQQGTRLPTSPPTCFQIVKDGYFIDWEQGSIHAKQEQQPRVMASAQVTAFPGAPEPVTGIVPPRPAPLTVAESRVGGTPTQDGAVLGWMRSQKPSPAPF